MVTCRSPRHPSWSRWLSWAPPELARLPSSSNSYTTSSQPATSRPRPVSTTGRQSWSTTASTSCVSPTSRPSELSRKTPSPSGPTTASMASGQPWPTSSCSTSPATSLSHTSRL